MRTLREVLSGLKELPDDWLTTGTVIRETGRVVFGMSSGQRNDGKEIGWGNENYRRIF